MPEAHKVVIVGGGIAGLEIASTLARTRRRTKELEITLIDKEPTHVWKPMLHTIAAGTQEISQQHTSYVAQARRMGFAYRFGELEGLDRKSKLISLKEIQAVDGRTIVPRGNVAYDTLVLAVGSQSNDFGTPGVAEHCLRIDSQRLAERFNSEVRLRLLEAVANNTDLSIAIVGGGATGVELAAELVQLVDTAEGYGAAGLVQRISITLLEAGPRLLPAFPEDISDATLRRLQQLGIRVMLGARVREARAEGLLLNGDTALPATVKVWAAGVKASDVLGTLDGLAVNRTNQIIVKPSLKSETDPDIYAVGDCASLTPTGREAPLPPTAQIAHQQAQHMVKEIGRRLNGKASADFRYRDFGALVSLGDYDAFGTLGKFGLFKGATIRGRLAQLSHIMLYRSHQVRLHGFWRGGLLWLVDRLNARVRAPIRLD